MILYANYDSPFGTIRIGYEGKAIVSIQQGSAAVHKPGTASDLAAEQLREYFAGSRRHFDFPIAPRGTDFQKAVWNRLLEIPYGEVRTYGQIAAEIGKPGASRAVGMACNRNPLWIVVPCHRVVGRNRKLIGYAGGLTMKKALLELEKP